MDTRTDPAPITDQRSTIRAMRATYVAFVASGVVMASWAARIPQIRDHLHLSAGQIGLVLLAASGGSVIALPLTGLVVGRFGSRRTVATMAVTLAAGLAVIGAGYLVGVPLVAAGFFVLGFSNGTWDVAMNVQGAGVERRLGRSVMSRFHAGFSVGTVAGALIGAGLVAAHVSVTVHLIVVAVLTAIVVPSGVRTFLTDSAEPEPGASRPEPAIHPLRRWSETRTLLIGVFVLAFAFAEGAGNDWSSLALIDGYHVRPAIGTLGFATFLAAMTAGRWFGPGLLDRYGRIAVLRTLAVLAIGGLAGFVFSPGVVLAFVCAAVWGVGVSLGFPTGMSAASDEASAGAARTSVVASIGYCAFLGGPPLIGLLANHVGTLRALIVIVAPLIVAFLVAPALRKPRAA